MGFFDNTKTTSNISQETVTHNANAQGISGVSLSDSGGAIINVTDNDAVSMAAALSVQALEFADSITKANLNSAIQQASSQSKENRDFLDRQSSQVEGVLNASKADQGTATELIKWGLGAVVAIMFFYSKAK